jgi:hypothetical protein
VPDPEPKGSTYFEEYWYASERIGHYETVYIEVEALFYERTGVVVWVKWY